MGLIFLDCFKTTTTTTTKDLDVPKRTTRIICFGLFRVKQNLHTLIRR